MRERDADVAEANRAALVRRLRHVLRKALPREPAAQLDLRDDRAAEPRGERDGVADVVVVAVCQGDEVASHRLALAVRARGVPREKGVHVEARARLRVDPERRVTEPGERGRHGPTCYGFADGARTIKRQGTPVGRVSA